MVAEEISNISGIPISYNLGKYLGVSSIHGRMEPTLNQNILDRMGSKLEGWKTRYLSLADRNVLARSVLSAIPFHSLQSAMVPKALCNKMDKMIRQFLWEGTNGKRKVYLVNWGTLTRLKEDGLKKCMK